MGYVLSSGCRYPGNAFLISSLNRVSRRFFSWFLFRILSTSFPLYLREFRCCLYLASQITSCLSFLDLVRFWRACLLLLDFLCRYSWSPSFDKFCFIKILSIQVLRPPTVPVSLAFRFTLLVVSKDFDWFPVVHSVVNRHSFSSYWPPCFLLSLLGHFFFSIILPSWWLFFPMSFLLFIWSFDRRGRSRSFLMQVSSRFRRHGFCRFSSNRFL